MSSLRIHLDVAVARGWFPLIPGDDRRPLGGTERLAVRLAGELAARGHRVSFRGGGSSGAHAGVEYLAGEAVVPDVDVWVLVEAERPPDLAARRVVRWSHSAQRPHHPDADALVAVSDYHAGLLRMRLSSVPIVAIPGGVDRPEPSKLRRDRFLYASSPDRGLHRLLTIWPAIWKRWHVPLAIAYDVRGVLSHWIGKPHPVSHRLQGIAPLLDQPGVLPQPHLSEVDIARLRGRSHALLYPLDPVLPDSELYALAVLEACAAGCPPVLAPVDCFPDEYGAVARFVEPGRAVYDADAWVTAIEETLANREERAAAAQAFAAERTWARFTDRWEALLEEVIAAPPRAERPSDLGPSGRVQRSWNPPALRA